MLSRDGPEKSAEQGKDEILQEDYLPYYGTMVEMKDEKFTYICFVSFAETFFTR